MITITHVTKGFGRIPAVDDASLHLEAGDSVALWGANGAGKTTLIRCVLGLLGFEGSILVGGHDVARMGKRARLLVGYVPQELAFHDELGVEEAVAYFARLKGLGTMNAGAALGAVGLDGHGRKRVRELSGGMKQRLALAIALLGDPPVLVLDEVTASLDAVGRDEFVHLLESLSGAGRTVLFASHRIEEVVSLARRVAVLERGRITEVMGREDFVARHGAGAALHLVMGSSVRDAAMRLLGSWGFRPHLNGVGIVVPVQPDQKAMPFRILADARIVVDDFDMVTMAHAQGLAGGAEMGAGA